MHSERALHPAHLAEFARAERQRVPSSLEEQLVELYVQTRPALLGYLRHLAGSTGEAEDLLQITFLRLFNQLQKGEAVQEMRGWLYRVAHNLAMDHLRRQGRAESAASVWLEDRRRDGLAGSVEDEYSNQQQINQVLNLLNPRERHCLLLRAEGLSYREIAGVVGISEKSVSVYLSRGLKKFGNAE